MCRPRPDGLRGVPGTSYELGRLAMVKAPALQRVGRAEEAVKLLRKAAVTFRAHGERLWYVDARIAEGAALYHLGAIEQALEVWRSVENDPLLDDVRTVRLAHNIALCHADLGL